MSYEHFEKDCSQGEDTGWLAMGAPIFRRAIIFTTVLRANGDIMVGVVL
jgi:hypothetical protein